MKHFRPVLHVMIVVLGLLTGYAIVNPSAQSSKKPGMDVPVSPVEQWNVRRCYVNGTESADIGLERQQSGLLRFTDCTDAANLRDIAARILSQNVGSVIASATTIAPTSAIHHVSGTTTIQTITVPTNCTPGCTIQLIPDAIWATNTSGNIALGSTAVVNKAIEFVWDGSKWSPSY